MGRLMPNSKCKTLGRMTVNFKAKFGKPMSMCMNQSQTVLFTQELIAVP
jgi:hypothetical protein